MSLDEDTELWRIHTDSYSACAMNPTPRPTIPGGGRFDSLDGSYSYTYLGSTPEAAVAESLCRELPVSGGVRLVPGKRIEGRRLTRVRVSAPLAVIALYGAHLAAIGQDTWLTKSDPFDYVLTREWAAALFAVAPTADGLVYRCRHDEDQFAWMLKTTPNQTRHPALSATTDSIRLDSPAGAVLVEQILVRYNAALASVR